MKSWLILLAVLAGWAAATVACSVSRPAPGTNRQAESASSYAQAWRSAAEWLLASRIESPPGCVWAVDPSRPETVSADLYSGYAGVVLFLLEAAHRTEDERYLAAGRAGADHLLERVETETDYGFYTGLAGFGYTLAEAARLTGDERYRAGARRAVERIRGAARARGAGVDWGVEMPGSDNQPSNDVISGTAGTGLFLLWAARELRMPEARDTAVLAGRRLVELGITSAPGAEGRKWLMVPGFTRVYPNFSHGTAGVAYFLATLYQTKPEPLFLDAAIAGARYLQSIATVRGDSCLIYRHEPDAVDLFYYSWCHGPAGTVRLYYQLYRITGQREWMDFAERLARGILESGIPETTQPGFWNVSQCCGSAGVAEFSLAFYQVTGKRVYLDLARRMSDDLVNRATRDGAGWKWVQAEHRIMPQNVVAQTGYMQGAAGIGLWLLRFDASERGERAGATLPDSPFS